jgi:hypothetical protein
MPHPSHMCRLTKHILRGWETGTDPSVPRVAICYAPMDS